MRKIKFLKLLSKPILLRFLNENLIINGFLINQKLKLKNKSLFELNKNKLIIKKQYIKTFLSNLNKLIDGVSLGFKIILNLKGKGLRIQIKNKNNLYLKLGYSHKIFLKIPQNIWIKISDRRRNILIYSFNYVLLKNLIVKLKTYYPLSLYKIRGFHNDNELLKIKKGKSKLGNF